MVTRDRRGSALVWVLGFIVVLGIVISASQVLARVAERQMYARNSVSRTELAAASAVEVLTDRLRGAAAYRTGNVSWPDLLQINVQATSLDGVLRTTGARVRFALDTLATGVRIVDIRDLETIPHDERVLAAWAQQPRVSWDGLPDVGGSVAARTVEVEVYATATGPREGRRMVTRRVAISTVSPFQHAVYVQGSAEMVSSGAASYVGGPVRVDGEAHFLAGAALIWYVGGVEARDGIVVSGAGQHVVGGTSYPAGARALASVTRGAAELFPSTVLAPWQGRVRIRPAAGGDLSPGRMQSARIAGSGECPDFDLACGGRGTFRPSVTVQRTTSGSAPGFSYGCGSAYDAGACAAAVGTAIRYVPYPFTTPLAAGQAQMDPTSTWRIWRGLFPDARREGSCDASHLFGLPAGTYRTYRCPTNAYGFEVDVGALPAIEGGVLAIRRAAGQVAGANASGVQEVVVLRNARALQGPLTVVSEIPVVIWGTFNAPAAGTVHPAMISAPRITVMPGETAEQLADASRWDVATGQSDDPALAAAPILAVQALTHVNVQAVLRSGFCRAQGGAYYGGSWEGLPATLGDWSRVGLRVNGAVEGFEQTGPGCAAYWAPLNGPQPGEIPWAHPRHRSVLFNRRLLVPAGQPPGSWHPDNAPLYGAIPGAPTRTQTRQLNSMGGVGVMRLIQDLRTIPPAERGSTLRPEGRTVAPALALPALPPLL
jgi:hypothetical protein